MWLFAVLVGALVLGYFGYGRFVERLVQPDPNRPVPACTRADGMDYVIMPTWRVYLVQLLNIAGLGPVFGPIMGALWGPQVFLWIVLGSILGGAVHDFLSGVMSMRNGGAGLPELIGQYLGAPARHVATFFILVLMILVGTVFVKGPAALIAALLPPQTLESSLGLSFSSAMQAQWGGQSVWLWLIMLAIFAYYVAATMLPVDKLIGRVYPLFALALLVMVAGLGLRLLSGELAMPRFTLDNLHPAQLPAWPVIFVTVSCGAISGFHATQSPMMARCLGNERHMRAVFYGAMIVEALIAVVWASAASGHYGGVEGLAQALGPKLNNTTVVVHTVCTEHLGLVGGALAIIGVVVLPITSGDTAFRVARLIAADYLKLDQARGANRYLVALPMFAASLLVNFIPFGMIWRYFGWANQTLAAFTLWAAARFLAQRTRFWPIVALPAAFMSAMCTTYLLVESRTNGGLGLSLSLGTAIGVAVSIAALVLFIVALPQRRLETTETRQD
ncbi:MAG: carbon starvation CstA family protein [Myxococcota bacterium]|jgi:carbon starvation protein CstA|nr:carbon starvation CstA family protein [Myxococcota bacterium]